MNEKKLLCQLKNPFIVNLEYSFQDRENLYLVLDWFSGGDLRYHIGKNRKFNEKQTKFFIACIFLGLEYLHTNGILHRDIKPENIILDEKGYLQITDLGIARIWKPDNQNDTSGTPGYMAPEVMCRQNHGVAVDYFALGVIAYECMMGRRPYLGRNRKELRDQILAKQVQIKKSEIPTGWSLEAADFINKTLMRKPLARLGVDGPDQIKEHSWFKDYPWDKLENREIDPPFVPAPGDENFDAKQVNQKNKEQTDTEQQKANNQLLRRDSVQESAVRVALTTQRFAIFRSNY
ncbi:Protein kinase-like domain [Pseudocohnilembus persalinus]|uniref:Protein kinase-like domain n=1 Tax=Pseudocohnilembus persalinus TaxID=266149 RepID=A0A0V0R4E6_PSEPJ|nr:Protein kinase-like domain [Pseudocohnilembus persalinus]|eukprot:KRX09353.1 Protein kinase-like domain [Pseudocohnilembus persalinus]